MTLEAFITKHRKAFDTSLRARRSMTLDHGGDHEGEGHRHAEAPLAGTAAARPAEGSPGDATLYLDGKMEQFWLRNKEEVVIFLMSVDSVDEADRLLKVLPLVRTAC